MAFAERDKQTIIELREISSKWLKNQLCPPVGFLGYGLKGGTYDMNGRSQIQAGKNWILQRDKCKPVLLRL
jgi:hypothetical protein